MSKQYICTYCGLNPAPLAYHEEAEDCQKAMREFTAYLTGFLLDVSAFNSAWELEPYAERSGVDHFKYIANKIGFIR